MLSWQNYEGPKTPYEKRQKLEKNLLQLEVESQPTESDSDDLTC